MKTIVPPAPSRLSPAAQVVENLRTFEARHMLKMTPSQRWVLACCEKQAGMSSKTAIKERPVYTEDQWRDKQEFAARQAKEYAEKHGIDT